mmetsp:Transcript_9637/g.9295  ORF Transcript_9637/g.9295 Transcript_9637/m.9295 type:complete len:154 (+) Transcript_9637:1656-2117(+)
MSYDFLDFGSLDLKCRFYSDQNLVQPQKEIDCQFTSRELDSLSVYIKKNTLNKGNYHFQFALDDFESPLFTEYALKVFDNPLITEVYPQVILYEADSDKEQSIVIIGKNFDQFKAVDGNDSPLKCKLKYQYQTYYYQFLYVKARVISENIIEC